MITTDSYAAAIKEFNSLNIPVITRNIKCISCSFAIITCKIKHYIFCIIRVSHKHLHIFSCTIVIFLNSYRWWKVICATLYIYSLTCLTECKSCLNIKWILDCTITWLAASRDINRCFYCCIYFSYYCIVLCNSILRINILCCIRLKLNLELVIAYCKFCRIWVCTSFNYLLACKCLSILLYSKKTLCINCHFVFIIFICCLS